MDAAVMHTQSRRFACYYRPAILATTAVVLLGLFWFASRYPQLVAKAQHVGQGVPTMAYTKEVLHASADSPAWWRIVASSVNWLDGMKIGMTVGVLFGAWLHTVLRYYPLKIGKSIRLNSTKGALVGIPMGVCANCAVPMACGVTRGNGRVETALGFLFSSPNFNPVVLAMTFMALPLAMGLTKYALLLAVILFVVPGLVAWLERSAPLEVVTAGDGACAVRLGAPHCDEPFWSILAQTARDYARHVWMLVKPTIALMLLASVASAALLVLVPWSALLAEVSMWRLGLISLIAVLMPVPIALDVMFAAQLYHQGVPTAYVMLFAMTLGTYSIIPSIYLWREVSKRLAVGLLAFFSLLGIVVGLIF